MPCSEMKRRGSHLENISMARFAFSCDSWKLHKHNWTSRTRTWSVGPFGFPGPSMPPIGERQGGNPDSNSPEPWGNRINELGMSAQSLQVCLFVTPWTIAHQAPLSMRFSRQEYWSGLPCPPPRIFLTQGSNLRLFFPPALAGGFFTTN